MVATIPFAGISGGHRPVLWALNNKMEGVKDQINSH